MRNSDLNQARLSRRRLLTATGLAAGSLFLPSLSARHAQAQSAAPIKRLVIMTTRHGTVHDRWRMLRSNADYGDWEYPFDDADPSSFSEILRPLHARRSNLLVVEGLSLASALADRPINAHNLGHTHLLTGAISLDDDNAGGPSVDQIIAQQIAIPGRIPSLELATRNPWLGGMVNLAARQRAPVLTDPSAIFQRLFPAGSGPMTQQPTERDRIRAARQSVLDFVSNEYQAIAPRLSGEDLQRISMHRQLIRDLETRIGSISSLSCSAPTLPARGNQLATAKAMADLTAAAFACDLTRVATIQIDQLDNEEFGAPPGDVHQDFAHAEFTDPNAAQRMTDYNVRQAEVFAYLVEALHRYTEGNGTLLDNTLAIWVSEISNGPHELDRMPVVMAGSAGGAFRTGRYVSYAQNVPNPMNLSPGDQARPIGPGHQHLLISIMRAMGLSDRNEIGATSVVTRDGKNTRIDLTGPLPRLS